MAEAPLICVIEIPKGSRNKYEYDPELGGIKLERFLSASVVYPTDCGFVPETLAPDGDPLNVLVCVSEPTFPGCAVRADPIGVLKMEDEKGPDDHVVCVPCQDPGWNLLADVADLPAKLRADIGHFFSIYKDLDPARQSKVNGWGDRAAALTTIREARSRFRSQHPDCVTPHGFFQPSTPRPPLILPAPPGSEGGSAPPRGSG